MTRRIEENNNIIRGIAWYPLMFEIGVIDKFCAYINQNLGIKFMQILVDNSFLNMEPSIQNRIINTLRESCDNYDISIVDVNFIGEFSQKFKKKGRVAGSDPGTKGFDNSEVELFQKSPSIFSEVEKNKSEWVRYNERLIEVAAGLDSLSVSTFLGDYNLSLVNKNNQRKEFNSNVKQIELMREIIDSLRIPIKHILNLAESAGLNAIHFEVPASIDAIHFLSSIISSIDTRDIGESDADLIQLPFLIDYFIRLRLNDLNPNSSEMKLLSSFRSKSSRSSISAISEENGSDIKTIGNLGYIQIPASNYKTFIRILIEMPLRSENVELNAVSNERLNMNPNEFHIKENKKSYISGKNEYSLVSGLSLLPIFIIAPFLQTLKLDEYFKIIKNLIN